MSLSSTTTTSTTVKRGRKPTQTNYFDVVEENAVRMYLTATTFEEKNKIYNELVELAEKHDQCAVKSITKLLIFIFKLKNFKLYHKKCLFIKKVFVK